jgi:hypothetical protein
MGVVSELRDVQQAIEGASTLAKTLNEELLDSTGKLLEMVELAGANVSRNVAEVNQSKGTLPEKVFIFCHLSLVGGCQLASLHT